MINNKLNRVTNKQSELLSLLFHIKYSNFELL